MTDLDSAVAAVKADLDTIKTNVAAIGTRQQGLSDQIAALQTQLAAAGVPQATLDAVAALKTEADSIVADTAALVPTPAPAP